MSESRFGAESHSSGHNAHCVFFAGVDAKERIDDFKGDSHGSRATSPSPNSAISNHLARCVVKTEYRTN
jgi:hypothetical protein